MQQTFITIGNIAYPLLIAAVLWLAAKASAWLAVKSQGSKAYAVAASTYELVRAVVEHVERHLRPTAQAALADGKLTREEGDALKAEALRLIKEALGQHGIARLQAVFGGGVDLLLSGWIERANREKELAQQAVQATTASALVTANP